MSVLAMRRAGFGALVVSLACVLLPLAGAAAGGRTARAAAPAADASAPGALLASFYVEQGHIGAFNNPESGQADFLNWRSCFNSPQSPPTLLVNVGVGLWYDDVTAATVRSGRALVATAPCRGSQTTVAEMDLATGRLRDLPPNTVAYGPVPGTVLTREGQLYSLVKRFSGEVVWSEYLAGITFRLTLSSDLTTLRAVADVTTGGWYSLAVGAPGDVFVDTPPGGQLAPNASVVAMVDAGRLVLVDAETGVEQDVGPAVTGGLSWSPDSSRLAYRVDSAAGHRVALLDLAANETVETDLVVADGSVTYSGWAPDSSALLLTDSYYGDEITSASVIDAATGTVNALPTTAFAHSHTAFDSLSRWAPDSSRLVTLGVNPAAPEQQALHLYASDGEPIAVAPVSHEVYQLGPWPASSEARVAGAPARPCTIRGTSGDDVLRGTPRDDVLCGRGGDDVIVTSAGRDMIVGGSGVDLVRLTPSRSGTCCPGGRVDLSTWSAFAGGVSRLSGVEGGIGTRFGDEFIDDGLANRFALGGGDDWVDLTFGADVVRGEAGDDGVAYGSAETVVRGPVRVDVPAGVVSAPDGDDRVPGVEGFAGTPRGDVFIGSGRGDTFVGREGADVLRGLGGADVLIAGGGLDLVRGGAGRDELRVQRSDDYSGGPGRDRCRVSGTWGQC